MNTPNTTLGTAPAAKLKKKFCLAALPFLVYAFTCGVSFFDYLLMLFNSGSYTQTIKTPNYSNYYYYYDYSYVRHYYGLRDETTITLSIAAGIATLLMFVAMAFLVVLLFMKARKPIMCVPFFAAAASAAVGMIGNVICLFFVYTDEEVIYEGFSIAAFLAMVLAFAAAGVLAILACKKSGKLITILSFVPAGISVISGLLYFSKWVALFINDNELIYIIGAAVSVLFACIPLTAALLLGGLWIANPEKKNKAKAVEAAPVV